MTTFLSGLFSLSLLFFFVGLVVSFFKSARKVGTWIGSIGFWGAVLLIYPLIKAEEREATEAGFIGADDYKEATKVGIKDPSAWIARKAEVAEQKRIEEAEKRKARDEQERIEAERQAAEDARCRNDIQCWGAKFEIEAGFACRPYVERLAKNNFEWYDGMLEPKFSHLKWRNKQQTLISYIGDKIKFQNGFGAWIIHTYECDYDPSRKAVVDVRARAGRLPL